MLFSRVDGDSHKWIDAGNRGKTDELIRLKMSRRSHCSSILPRKKKFFATSESTRKAAGKNNIKTVHDVPLKPGNLSLSANYADQIQNCSATSILKLQDHLPDSKCGSTCKPFADQS